MLLQPLVLDLSRIIEETAGFDTLLSSTWVFNTEKKNLLAAGPWPELTSHREAPETQETCSKVSTVSALRSS